MKINILPFIILFGCTLLTTNAIATIRYVKQTATGTGTGASWANASGDLQLMINNSASGDTIWVAAGTHKPTRLANATGTIDVGNRDDAYVLKSGVKIFGGFSGTETLFSQRNFTTNVTILSGDIGTVGIVTDNCYHVVISAGNIGSAELDGFTITAGNANFVGTIFVNAFAISQNFGGGIYINTSSPTIANCIITLNTVLTSGGGIYNNASSPTISNCVFTNNTAILTGGAITNSSSSSIISICTFTGNTASGGGGAIYNLTSSSVTTACTFTNNRSANGGAVYYNGTATASITNCLLSGDTATNGAAVFFNAASGCKMNDCTISGNRASVAGGGLYFTATAATAPEINNSIIYGNKLNATVNNIFVNAAATSPIVSYSDIEGGFAGTNNIDKDPLFVSPLAASVAPTTGGDYRLQNCSPAYNAGSNALIPGGIATDLDGNARIINTTVDVGAYETLSWVVPNASGVVFVDSTKTGNGSSWANALSNLADALKIAKSNTAITQIWVANGTYYPAFSADSLLCTPINARDKAFVLVNNVKVYGGFAGGETLLSQRNPVTNVTILSGDIGTTGVNTDNCYHVLISSGTVGTAVLDGFTIKAGNGNGAGSITVNSNVINRTLGGGMEIFSSGLVINNCIFTGNLSANGTAIYNANSTTTINNCVFSGNTASSLAGGIYNTSSSTCTLFDCTFLGNAGILSGGGIYNNGVCDINACSFLGNTSTGGNGGGIVNSGINADMSVTNCVLAGNTSVNGGGLYNSIGVISISNSTITANRITTSGGGIYFSSTPASTPAINNCIIYGNKTGTTPSNIFVNIGATSPTVSYSDVEGGFAGTNNIDKDPLFVSPLAASAAPTTGGDYRLQNCSPAYNAGSNALIPLGIVMDLDGNARIINTTVDMGAYEILSWVVPTSGVVFVDSTKTGDGSSWANALSNLADALKIAKSNTAITQIWVANGTYYPAFSADSLLCTPADARDKAFVLVNNVKVYGGFAGGETLLSQRNPATNITILSGNIGSTAVSTDNCYHVVISSGAVGTAELNGFTITAANGNATGTITVNTFSIVQNLGGGININTSSPIIDNCIITANTVSNTGALGGGLHNLSASPVISNCTFSNNTNTTSSAAGMYNNASSPTITNCSFTGNVAANSSGALFNFNSPAIISNCSFTGNICGNRGGAIGNSSSASVITACTFSGNRATQNGGGLIYFGTSAATLINCTITGNLAANGGGICFETGTAKITNCTVAANRGTTNGAGIYFTGTVTPAPEIYNSIIYSNKIAVTINNIIVNTGATSPTVSYCDVEGGFAGTNNINSDPLFTSPQPSSAAPTIAGDYSLQRCSPAINEGNNALIPGGITDDILGNPRIALGNVDMGAYEMTHTLLNIVPNAAGVVFVDFFKSGNGSSWVNACSNVADALLAADDNNAIKEIWVAKGTYYPKYNPFANLCSPNDRNNAFILVSKVKMFGGFIGGETFSTQANPISNVTILSGDIGVTFTNTDNSYHVVIGAGALSTASLNGFTIKSGNANAATTITVNNRNIIASCGAGIHLVASSPAVTNCIISNNLATSNGAGMYDSLASAPVVSNCTFTANVASKDAGALYNYTSSPTISNCTFSGNSTTNVFGNSGGAMVNYTSSPDISNCTFSSNSSSSGGAMENKFTSIPTITDCSFTGNTASFGGALENIITSAAVITNCIFSGNTATSLGGAINNNGSSAAITNCLFSGNLAAEGGAVDNQAASNATYINCTFAANRATAGCGAITNQSSSNAIYRNNIIWGNTGTSGNTISNLSASTPAVSNSLIEGGYVGGTAIITSNPLFINQQLASAAATTAGDYRLQNCSPAINAGSNALIPTGITTDLDGFTRTSNITVDMGAYEKQFGTPNASGIVFVDSTKNGDGSSWANAVPQLANALFAAKNNAAITQIWVANGTYYPLYDAVSFSCTPSNNRDKTFLLVNNVKVYGGFAGGETLLSQRDWVNNVTTLSGDIGVASDTSDNSYHVVVSAGAVGTAALDGFTITLGTAASNSTVTINSLVINRSYGGGIHCATSSPQITNCTFYKNYAYNYGAGMYNTTSSLIITGCTYNSNNVYNGTGGGIYNNVSSPTITGCTFSNNLCISSGAGLVNFNCTSIINRCIFTGNLSSNNGGGLSNSNSTSVTITNCVFSGNKAPFGAATSNFVSTSSYNNCTFSGNNATASGGAIYNANTSVTTVKNSIIYGNTAPSFPSIQVIVGTTVTASYSLIEGGFTGTGNINVNPAFVNPVSASMAPTTAGDYRIPYCSGAVNTGDSTLLPIGTTVDLDSNTRVKFTNVDMGAYEVQTLPLTITPTAGIVYVDSAKNGNGSSWANAAGELADALKAAKTNTAITQIWVAKGTYKPIYDVVSLNCSPVDIRDKSFLMVKNVQLYGGFAGTETLLSQRDYVNNVTTLSGDIGVLNDSLDNCYHVVVCTDSAGTATLDGFTVTKGYASGSVAPNVVVNTKNTIRPYGGGMQIISSSPLIQNVIFSNNSASQDAGALYMSLSLPVINNCTFSGNVANTAGAIEIAGSSNCIINRCRIINNKSLSNGSGIYNSASNPSIRNCLIAGNITPAAGGGIYNSSSSPSIINCTIAGNKAFGGGGIYTVFSSNALIKNSIIWGNIATSSGNAFYTTGGGAITVSYSNIEGGNAGTANINSDPLFINPQSANLAPTSAGDYRLPNCSPCINMGNNTLVVSGDTTDLDDTTRIKFNLVDMGAYELQATAIHNIVPSGGVVYVDKTKTAGGNGSSWPNAVKELADALKAAKSNTAITQIWVAKGTYLPLYDAAASSCTSSSTNRDNAFILVNNVKVYGGFAGGETLLTQRDWITNPTILSGDIGVAADTSDNCYHVVISAGAVGTAALDGFSITKGNGISANGNITVNATLINREYGGGVYLVSSTPDIINCTFTGNFSKSGGAGVFNNISSSNITFCNFFNNVVSAGGGGGFYNESGSPKITNCKFSANTAAFTGGAVSINNGSPTITNCVISGNFTSFYGGGIYNANGTANIINCTVAGNKAVNNGGGLYNILISNIKNSIFYGNTASIGNAYFNLSGSISATNSLIEGGIAGLNIITTNPAFVNAVSSTLAPTTTGDYHITDCSPAVNAGDSILLPSGTTVDADSNTRVKFANVDMGAYEVQTSTVYSITPNASGVVFVDITKTGGIGNSWTNAVKQFADALKAAKANTNITEIWVAKGTYLPQFDAATLGCTPTDNKDKSFLLVNNVKIYGGFAGGETAVTQRDWINNSTILSGDIGINGDSTDNCYHVVVSAGAVGTATLNGFTITKGNASLNTNNTIKGFSVNRSAGAGLSIVSSSPDITNCIIKNNTAQNYGGGMLNASSEPAVKNCTFIANNVYSAASAGGAMYNATASPAITNCVFSSNTSSFNAGAIFIEASASNLATIKQCVFNGNSAVSGGGAVYIDIASSSTIFTNCVFSGNKAFAGGAILNANSFTTIIVYSSTFAGNNATNSGSAIFNSNVCSASVSNSIIYGNTTSTIPISDISGALTVNYSLVEGGIAGTGNISENPGFVNPISESLAPTTAGDYHISNCSAGIDVGESLLLPPGTTIDLDSNQRVKFFNIDMGAYEVQTSVTQGITPTGGVVYVDKTKSGNGSSWANAVTELADALKAAKFNSAITQIWVAKGTYFPLYEASSLGCTPSDNRDKSFVLVNNLKIYGGFNGGETLLSQRNWVANTTILNGDIGVASDTSDNAYHVCVAAGAVGVATLDGFTITRGVARNASGSTQVFVKGISVDRFNGGGMIIANSSPTINNCIFTANVASSGGGMYTVVSSPTINNSSFTNNFVLSSGGGLFNHNAIPKITNCIFSGNKGTGSGGGLVNNANSNATIKQSYFTGNTAGSFGGGIFNNGSSPTITNCVITGNNTTLSGAVGGGGIGNVTFSSPTIINTTIASNKSGGNGGGIYNTGTSNPNIKNSIVYGNIAVSGAAILNSSSIPVVSYSMIEGGFTGTGNISGIPAFINAVSAASSPTITGDYHLLDCSAGVDAGDSTLLPAGTTKDIDSIQRVKFYNVDMGAYEAQTSAIYGITPTAGILYVDKTKSGNGSSWASALTELGDALKAAKNNSSISQIWVAKGTYLPKYEGANLGCAASGVNRDNSFVLVNNVKLFGGFAGGETSLNQRDWVINPTILSGDIGLTSNNTDNCYHVVVSAGAVGLATLDGFTVTKGNANSGLNNTINNKTIYPNAGGGMYITTSSPAINNCIFTSNNAVGGGGMFIDSSAAPIINNSSFLSNTSAGGGALFNSLSAPTMINCVLQGNSSASLGGGVYNYQATAPTITNCLISGNSATNGAGIMNEGSSPTIVNSTIASNNASANGGGVYNIGASAIIIKNSIIFNNIAATGSGIQIQSGTATVSYSTVQGGFAGTGNIIANPLFVNSQLATAAPTTSGDYRLSNCSPAINAGDNSLIPGGITTDLDNNTRVKYVTVDMGAYENSTILTTPNISGVVFVDSSKNGDGSSWANASSSLAKALRTAKSDTTIKQIWVAIGTYYPEFDAATLGCSPTDNRDKSFVLVNNVKVYGGFAGGETLLSQRNWVSNTTTLSGDIGVAGDTTDNAYHVLISSGAVGSAELNGFIIKRGIAVGGSSTITVNANNIDRTRGAGLYTNLSSPAINNCIFTLNAAGIGGGVYNTNSTPSFTNCQVSNNKSSGGGGMANVLSNAIITNCTFSANLSTSNGGGGVMNTTASPIITDCIFTGNSTTGSFGGGGILNNNVCSPVITNCIFSGNFGGTRGGGMSTQSNPSGTPIKVVGCYFISNNANGGSGGGISSNYASGNYINCVFSGNFAPAFGGAIYTTNLGNSNPPATTYTNCTIAGNRVMGTGGAMYNTDSANAFVKNCIIYGNTAPFANNILNNLSKIAVSNSLVEGGFSGTGNIDLNPNFTNPQLASAAPTTLGDYRLQACSPAVNAGDSTLLPIGTTHDLDSNARIKFTNVDLGAYEMQAVDYNNSTWRGFNTNWDSVINWCGGYIPTDTTNVIIPTGVTNYPVISSSNANTKNISLANNTSITINNTGKLTIKGAYTNSGSIITNNGTLVMDGSAAGQIFPGALGTIAAMNNLELSNTSGISLNKSFSITGTLTPTAGATNLNNDTITLSSTASGTAKVAPVQAGASFTYTGTGRFMVQRFHPARRAWRLMTSPLFGTGTIFETWQNNGVYTVGKGTLVTGPGPTGAAGNGLDTSQLNNPSLKSGVPITNILNTKVPLSNNTGSGADNKGYFIFIRGDRNPINTNIINSNITTLSSVGKLQIGAQNFVASATANGFTLIGNPYACPVNFSLLNRTNLANRFYVWDPKLNSVGGYVVIEKLTGLLPYTPTPASPGGQDSIIQSSQAIYVQTISATTASLGFVESNKVATQNAGIFRPTGNFTMPPSVQSSLYVVNPDTAILADGNIVVFDDAYNNGVDIDDAIKFTNINETFGLVRNGQALAIERKQLNPANDTVFFKLTKTTQQNYRFEFEFSNININNLTPFFEDDYLHTSTLLNNDGISTIDFNINGDAASANPLRFRIVFKQATTLPVTFTSIKAWKQNQDIAVEWKVENQLNIREYIIEKSTDGRHFSPIGTQAATGNTSGIVIYNFPDVHPVSGNNYYRVRSIGSNGLSSYSKIVNVFIGDKKPLVIVSPNPIVNNKIVLQMNDMPVGKYVYRLFNSAGQLITTSTFNHAVVSETKTLVLPVKPAAGSYQLEVIHLGNMDKMRVGVMIE